MQYRSPRTLLAISAVLALTAAVVAPTAAFSKGPGPGAGSCDGDCAGEQPQAQQPIRARDGSGGQGRTRARDASAQQTETQANAGGGAGVQARAGIGSGRGADATVNQGGYRNGSAENGGNVGAGRGWDEDVERGPGSCEDCEAEMGSLNEIQVMELLRMANEEKLAHDVYVTLYEQFGLPIFERIAMSEARHQGAVDVVLQRYGIDNTTTGLGVGSFSDEGISDLWTQLMDPGPATAQEALEIGVLIEKTDIEDLELAMEAVKADAPDAHQMYSHLLTASGHHLAAFERQL